ncbi:hypothetical protein ACIA5H_37515 [Nocardia sp. NPDC051900]|uniref:hypothetical protein n=1 Tax=Nocardia sp. NPDC051900 TaxID=3364326 RepID=UPI00378EC4BF
MRTTAETDWPTVEIVSAILRNDASAVIAPSVAHIANPRVVTEFADLYVVGRSRIYRRGRRWS